MEENRDRLNENFDPMLKMRQQMMNNLRGMMSRWFPWADQFMSPEMKNIKDSMPNMENLISELQKMAPGVSGLMPNFPFMMMSMVPQMLSGIRDQAVQMLSDIRQMNQIFFDMMRQIAGNTMPSDDKLFDLFMKVFTPQSAEEEIDLVGTDDAEFVEARYVEAVVVDQDD